MSIDHYAPGGTIFPNTLFSPDLFVTKKRLPEDSLFKNVPRAGIEPARPLWPQDFKSCVSTYSTIWAEELNFGADDKIRTCDLNLGKVALYQLSYIRELFRTLLL